MKRVVVLPLLFYVSILPLTAQTLLHELHPQPRQAYMRFFSAVFIPGPGHEILLDPAQPMKHAAARINTHLRSKGQDTLNVRIWRLADSLESGIFLGIRSDFINGMLNNIPDQPVRVTSTYPGPEGYVLDALPMRVLINACDEAGLHYGVETLQQLLFPTTDWWGLEACRIIDLPQYPRRCFYHSTNVLVGDNVTASKALWDTALRHRLNGVHFNDSKFSRLTTLPQRYLDSLASLRDYAAERRLNIIPGVMPFGYSNGLLFHNPNLASGLPVRTQRLVFEDDTARAISRVDVGMSNGGFEQRNGHHFPGFRFIDQPGLLSFADTLIRRSGSASIRFENFADHSPVHGHGRISYWTPVTPFTQYHVSAWVRTEDLQPATSINISVLGNASYNLAYNRFAIPSTKEWTRIDFTFNSLEADSAGIYWGLWGARSGRIWWDDLAVHETAFVNLIRREGAPLVMMHPELDIAYTEGIDYDTLRDPLMGNRAWSGNYDSWHTPPTLRRLDGGSLNNGDTILMSYHHAVVIHSGQVMATMSHPEVYDILDREFAVLDSVLRADTYFMQHDEIRTLNWDTGDEIRGLRPAEIIVDNVHRCVDIIRKHSSEAEIMVWSDMFDEFHNAVAGPYYLVRGDLRGSADGIPTDLGIVNWNGRDGIVQQSLRYFSDRGFRQTAAPYYDKDEQQIRIWKEWLRDIPHVEGMMYTTWASRYDHLEAFGDYAWNHAPYIYHFPPNVLRPGEDMYFPLRIEGDRWDEDWELEHVTIHYRSDPGLRFSTHEVQLHPGVDDMASIAIPHQASWLQWYVTAGDNRGWVTRVPLGDTLYFELGAIASAVERVHAPGTAHVELSPNPLRSGSPLLVSWSGPEGRSASLHIVDLLGRELYRHELGIAGNGMRQSRVVLPVLPRGTYSVLLRCDEQRRHRLLYLYH